MRYATFLGLLSQLTFKLVKGLVIIHLAIAVLIDDLRTPPYKSVLKGE